MSRYVSYVCEYMKTRIGSRNYVITEAEKPQDLQSAGWRAKRTGGAAPVTYFSSAKHRVCDARQVSFSSSVLVM